MTDTEISGILDYDRWTPLPDGFEGLAKQIDSRKVHVHIRPKPRPPSKVTHRRHGGAIRKGLTDQQDNG